MPWNFRVMRKTARVGRRPAVTFGIHEVFYADDDGRVTGWSEGSSAPIEETIGDLRITLGRMQEALDKPVLDHESGEETET